MLCQPAVVAAAAAVISLGAPAVLVGVGGQGRQRVFDEECALW